METVYLVYEYDIDEVYVVGIFSDKENAIEQAKSRFKKHVEDYEETWKEKPTDFEQMPGISVKEVPLNVMRYIQPTNICYQSWKDEKLPE